MSIRCFKALGCCIAAMSLVLVACGDEDASDPSGQTDTPATDADTEDDEAAETEGSDEATEAAEDTEQPDPTVVRISGNGVTSDMGLFLARDRGYFAEVGVRFEFNQVRSAGDIIPLIASGDTDVYASAFSAGILNAIAGGVGMEVVADKGRLTDGSTPSYLMMLVRSDLADEISGPEDFDGRAIAWGDPASASTMVLENYLSEGGLALDDVRLTTLSMPDRIVALEEGGVDLASTAEPTGSQALLGGYAEKLFDYAEVIPNQQQAVLAFSSEWAEANPDAARSFISAYVCGVEDYNQILESGESVEEMWAILEEERGSYPEGLLTEAIPPAVSPEGYPNVDNIGDQITWYVENGYVEQELAVDEVVNTEYLDNRIPCDQIRGN